MSQPALPPGQYSPLVNPPMDTALLRTWEQTTPDDGHRQIYQRLRRAIELSNADNASIADLNALSARYESAVVVSQEDRADLRALIVALTTRVAALESRTLRGTTGTGSVSSLLGGATNPANLTVTLKQPMPDANYIALPIIDATSGINLSAVTATVTAKTATTATVRISNSGVALLQTIAVTVIAVQLA